MTKFLNDILAEPGELSGVLSRMMGPQRDALERAAAMVNSAGHVCITGIGSSWHAGMAVQSFFDAAGRHTRLTDASEFLFFGRIPQNAVLIVLSRSGRSFEIAGLVEKARQAGAPVIGITNTPDSPLARGSDVALLAGAKFDHLVSVSMYSGLALVGALLAAALKTLDDGLAAGLSASLSAAGDAMDTWREAMAASSWFSTGEPVYFLARGASLASCHEARLAWEEAAKCPACAMTTGGFRHGPQEMIHEGSRICLWIDQEKLREEDLALSADARKAGARVFTIGQDLPADAGDLVVNVPPTPAGWQFLVDVIPAQLAAEHLAGMRGADCDTFRLCPYVIESAYGL